MAPIKTAVLGAGMSLQVFHAPLILSHPDLFTLHSVMERSAEIDSDGTVKASKAQDKYGKNVKISKDLEGILQDEEVELVVIGVPNNLHFEYGKRCFEAGKHVLLEKPLTVTYEQTTQLIEIARKHQRVLYCFQNRRWDADFLAVRKLIDAGTLGPINEFTSHFDRYRPNKAVSNWKESSGQANDAIYNLGSHQIDQALLLFGKPEKITCMSYNIRSEPGLDDSFILHMHYPASHSLADPYPLLVTCRASILSSVAKQLRFKINGKLGSYTKYGMDPQEAALKEFDPKGLLVGQRGWGEEPKEAWGTLEIAEGSDWKTEVYPSPAGSYQVLYQNLHDVIRGKNEQLVKPEQTALCMQVIELALQSSREGRTIALP